MSIRRRFGDEIGPDRAIGTWAVFHHYGLTEDGLQPFGEHARDVVRLAAGPKRHHHTDRFAWIRLGETFAPKS